MKKLHLTLIFSLALLAASSQKVYFFYIQTESSQPFYVKLDKKIQYSSPNGYIILPKLYDSSYKFSIGFPQDKWQEQNFVVNVNKKDHGYLLKSVPDKGWGLFDMQSMELLMAVNEVPKKPENGPVTPFTEILSKAADDPSLKEKTVQVKPEEKKPEEIVAVQEPVKTEPAQVQNGTSVADNEKNSRRARRKANKETKTEQIAAVSTDSPVKEVTKPEVKEEAKPEVKEETKPVAKEETKPEVKEETKPVVKEESSQVVKEESKPVVTATEEYKKSQVKRYAESSTTEGFGLVFVDQYANGNQDTIRLVIPNPKPVINTIPETPKEEKKFLEINTVPENKAVTEQPKEETNPEEKRPEEKKPEVKRVEEKPVAKIIYPNGCTAAASESDLSKLGRKMKTVNDSEEKMIGEAKKYFKTTCFSTNQVKELGAQFINDEARYNFFDLAYKYVIDPENYIDLQAELKDPYYLSRFKAMLRN